MIKMMKKIDEDEDDDENDENDENDEKNEKNEEWWRWWIELSFSEEERIYCFDFVQYLNEIIIILLPPYILTTSSPDSIDNILPATETTSFYIQALVFGKFKCQ
jgi:hypothetical protein